MLNLNIRDAIEGLSTGLNNPPVKPPVMDDPNKGHPDATQNPARQLPRKIAKMLSESDRTGSGLEAKPDRTPLEYQEGEVQLEATAIPENEAPKVEERKGFKQNLMEYIMKRFEGGDSVDRANSAGDGEKPSRDIKGDPTEGKRPTPKSLHNPPLKSPPNPKITPNLPPNPTTPTHKLPKGQFPTPKIPRPRGLK